MISIKDPETARLARALAAITAKQLTTPSETPCVIAWSVSRTAPIRV